MKFLTLFLLLFLCASVKADSELKNIKELAQMIGVEFESLKFMDDTKKPISAAEFNSLVESQRSFNIKKLGDSAILEINPLDSDLRSSYEKSERELTKKVEIAFPEFELLSTSGKKVSLENLKGTPTLLSFYYSTCIPCIIEVPYLNELADKLEADIKFLAVTYEDKNTARQFSTKYGFSWDSIVNAEELIDEIGLSAYPVFVLLDERGMAINVKVGNATQNNTESLMKWIEDSGVIVNSIPSRKSDL